MELALDFKENGAGKNKKKPNHVEFVEKFKAAYESMVNHPFKTKKAHFAIAHRLIRDHGMDAVVAKVTILGSLCRDRSVWFTKNGWADFTIENLSNKWNSILEKRTKTDDFKDALKKVREDNERIKRVLGHG